MRKDYVAVAGSEIAEDESGFVERYWSEIWERHQDTPNLSALARRDEYRVMRPFLATLPKASRILGAGCGLGEWTVFLAREGYDTVGLDLSGSVIDVLQRRFPANAWVRGDIRETGFDTQSFDACFSWGAFEHFESGLGDCLREAHRVTRPGGFLFISVPFQNWRHILRDARRLERWDPEFTPGRGYAQPHRFYQWRLTRTELQRELELHGFEAKAVVPIHKLSGVGRWLQSDVRLFRTNSPAYLAARRACAVLMPASYISHMLLAVGRRR